MEPYRFQVDLRGIIDLLSGHLYSSPRVFLRELLQNAVDAIRARQAVEPGHRGAVEIDLVRGANSSTPTMGFSDNGIGLTEEEVHRFVSTIGASSKREALEQLRKDMIGQFGIGLLSCFLVADEVVMVTKSIDPESPALEWIGQDDGTYVLRPLDGDIAPGTTVYLRCRADRADLFRVSTVRQLARHYGGMLPFPIAVSARGESFSANSPVVPWRHRADSPQERDRSMRAICRAYFKFEPMDWLPIRSAAGQAEGVAFIHPDAIHMTAKGGHLLYLKNMLLTENATEILPPWAFFVRCVLNVDDLRPTASRESLYQDESLEAARRGLGRSLKRYLYGIAGEDPEKLRRIVSVHKLAMTALALEEDEFFRLVVGWIPFETSVGWMTLGELREESSEILYTATTDQFRELAPIATAKSIVVVNGGHTHEVEFLEKLGRLDPDVSVSRVNALRLLGALSAAPKDLREGLADFLAEANVALARHHCRVQLRSFPPEELPALYVMSGEQGFERSIGVAKEKSNALWSAMMDRLRDATDHSRHGAVLCLNALNPLIRNLTRVHSRELHRLTAETLYVQALLLGHHPLRRTELQVLSRGVLRLIELSISREEEAP